MDFTVLVPIANGVEELEAVTIIDVLRRAGAQVTVAGVSHKTVTASKGLVITADTKLKDCLDVSYDLIVLPGGVPGVYSLRDCQELVDLLKEQDSRQKMIAAICAAPQEVLSYHQILKNRPATGHPGFTEDISNKSVLSQRVVVDGNLVTSRGAGTALEFSLTLVQLLYGRDKALEVADSIVAAPGIF